MNLVYGVASILLGAVSFALADPAGVPVLGLALAAAGLVRESRREKRTATIALCGAGALLSLVGCIIAIRARVH